jgi:hypothetical protein
MHPRSLLLALPLAFGCASSGSQTRVVTDPVKFEGERGYIGTDVIRTRETATSEINAPFDEVWRVLPEVFGRLNFGIERADEKDRSITSRFTRFRGVLDGSRLSTFFECGQSAMGKTADRYHVLVRVTSAVRPAGEDRTTLRTTVTAAARPDDNGATAVTCDSRGTLEKRVEHLVATHVVAR